MTTRIFLFILINTAIGVDCLDGINTGTLLLVINTLMFQVLNIFIYLLNADLDGGRQLFTVVTCAPGTAIRTTVNNVPLTLNFTYNSAILAITILTVILATPLNTFTVSLDCGGLLGGK